MKRVAVQVDSEQMESGEIVPIRITWRDGRVWNIDRVIHSCASPLPLMENMKEFATRFLSVVRKDTYTDVM